MLSVARDRGAKPERDRTALIEKTGKARGEMVLNIQLAPSRLKSERQK